MRIRRRAIVLAILAIALSSAAAGAIARGVQGSAAPVSRIALAQKADPVGAPGRTLGLSRVKIPSGARIALHHHPGTQIAYIESGVLTYSVRSGAVDVRQGAADQSPKLVRHIGSGKTGKIKAGQWIVEQPGTVHRARNDGRAAVRILLASLFTNGSQPSLPIK